MMCKLLQNVKEVTGYVLLMADNPSKLNLTSLTLIRGESLLSGKYSLYFISRDPQKASYFK